MIIFLEIFVIFYFYWRFGLQDPSPAVFSFEIPEKLENDVIFVK